MTKKLPPVYQQKLRAVTKAIADQAQVHRREILALAVEHQRMKEALAAAVQLLRWIEDGRHAGVIKWTQADSEQLKEWEELSK